MITGGAGFIGTNFVYHMAGKGYGLTVLDKLTYAGGKDNLEPLISTNKVKFINGDICDTAAVKSSLEVLTLLCILQRKATTHAAKPTLTSFTAQMLKVQR